MEIVQFGGSGLRVSELCLGTMTFGREADEAESRRIVDRFLDDGGNFVDTADGYGSSPGQSEEIVGRAIAARREEVVLATKVRFPMGPGPNDRGLSRRHIRQAAEGSLRRLNVEWIDLYQVHSWDPTTPLEETLSALNDLVRDGIVRYLGVSNFAGWQVAKSLGLSALHGWEGFVSLQASYSLIARDLERELLPMCLSESLAVMPFGALGGGILTGKYRLGEEAPVGTRGSEATGMARRGMEQRMSERNFAVVDVVERISKEIGRTPAAVALNWALRQRGITSPIVGARSVEQLEDNLKAVGWQLEKEHVRELSEVSAIDLGYPRTLQLAWQQQGI